MKRVLSAVLVAMLMVPSVSYAGGRRGWHGHDYNGAAIAAGVLGGLATGIILDRVLLSPPPPAVYYPQPAYYPPPPPPSPPDPYDTGYSDGYSRGVERGRYERYDLGRRRGYADGYEDARAGRAY